VSADDLRAEIAALRAEIAALRPAVRLRPITSWRGVAEVVGVSEDTVARRRREAGDRTRAWFADDEAVRAWWWGLHAGRRRAPSNKPTRNRAP
jgi:hypothetical protein